MLGLPLGLGKANHVVNALYRRAAADPGLRLTVFTALTLEPPQGGSLLERRFLGPLAERLYGAYPALEYARAVRAGTLPRNVEVAEFYFRPGAYLRTPYAQQRYVSLNYSHVVRALAALGVNAVTQLVAARGDGAALRYSLGSNPDLTLDLLDALPPERRPFVIGEVSSAMPFMPHDAEVPPEFFDAVLASDGCDTPLFAVPNEPVELRNYAIALHVASAIPDGGTLQIGIGSLADAIAHVIRLREQDNGLYRMLVERLAGGVAAKSLRKALPLELERFDEGLYGNSEMLVEGLLDLLTAGVLRREVADGISLHAAFFLGSARFYRALRELPEPERRRIAMTRVSFTNTLERGAAPAADRRGGRFVNSAMMVSLAGTVVSDTLADGRVVSGVGGQHDFVAMAHALPDARAIIALPATRTTAGRAQSNIVANYPQATIARQLRDVVVTEYGLADLRGASDRDVAAALVCIADSRFQEQLVAAAKAAGKLESGYRVPDAFRNNLPSALTAALLADERAASALPHYPLGTDFTAEEARLAVALQALKPAKGSLAALRPTFARGFERALAARYAPLLERMGLARPRTLAERASRRLLLGALAATESARPLLPGH